LGCGRQTAIRENPPGNPDLCIGGAAARNQRVFAKESLRAAKSSTSYGAYTKAFATFTKAGFRP
jgi:hypothetical protein